MANANEVKNFATLKKVDESVLAIALENKFRQRKIYSYAGDILLALNPYETLEIYGQEYEAKYHKPIIRVDHPCHIYAISNHSFQQLQFGDDSQCCVVSGLCGAGKTESSRLLLHHILHLSLENNGRFYEIIFDQAHFLTETFGNAKTTLNDNSSRFTNFTELKYDSTGNLVGASVSNYMFEKSRVTGPPKTEKNFHVFDYMFAGMSTSERNSLFLGPPEDHRILQSSLPFYKDQSNFKHCKDQWGRFHGAISVIGFQSEVSDTFVNLLASIIHLTNIRFDQNVYSGKMSISNPESLEAVEKLLAVDHDELLTCLTKTETLMNGEKTLSWKSVDRAKRDRDALCHTFYEKMFNWVFKQINTALNINTRPSVIENTISILDPPGFEDFEDNSFEQLCINIADGQLQNYYDHQVFTSEIEDSKMESAWGVNLDFEDTKSSTSLLSILDDVSRSSESSEDVLVDRLQESCKGGISFHNPKSWGLTFTINHYNGPVKYTCPNILKKNQNLVPSNLIRCICNSKHHAVSNLFMDTAAVAVCSNDIKTKKSNAQKTTCRHIQDDLADLLNRVNMAKPHFIRCLKPNSQQSGRVFDYDLIRRQLRHFRVLETIKIRRTGYSLRFPHSEFFNKYKHLVFPLTSSIKPTASNCEKLLNSLKIKSSGWVVGKKKVFLKYHVEDALTIRMEELSQQLALCPKSIRSVIARSYSSLPELSTGDAPVAHSFAQEPLDDGANGSNNNDRENEEEIRRAHLRQEAVRLQSALVYAGQYSESLLTKWAAVVQSLKKETPTLRRVNVPAPLRSGEHEVIQTKSDSAGLYLKLRQVVEGYQRDVPCTSAQAHGALNGRQSIPLEGMSGHSALRSPKPHYQYQWRPNPKNSSFEEEYKHNMQVLKQKHYKSKQ